MKWVNYIIKQQYKNPLMQFKITTNLLRKYEEYYRIVRFIGKYQLF